MLAVARVYDSVMIDLTELRRRVRYDPVTGRLFWTDKDGEAFATATSHGYRCGRFHQRKFKAHQIVWLLHYDTLPPQLDHVSGDRSDNRLENLRAADAIINARNRRLARSKSGIMGVRRARSGRWQAYIGRPQQCLGTFDTIGEAAQARIVAIRAMGYHPNHGQR